ncbi:MAG: PDZ domain-containing protein [Magnetococcus sp. DMHC-6]
MSVLRRTLTKVSHSTVQRKDSGRLFSIRSHLSSGFGHGVRDRWIRHLASGLNVLIILLLAHDMADLTWQMLGTGALRYSLEQKKSSLGAALPKEVILEKGSKQITGFDLFGKIPPLVDKMPVSPAVAVSVPEEDAPDTRLDLTLLGVVLAHHSATGSGWALVKMQDSSEKIAVVGDTLANEAIVRKLYADRILLQRGARYETLRMPRDSLNLKTPLSTQKGENSVVEKRTLAQVGKSALTEENENLLNQFRENPESLFDMIQMEPIQRGGQMAGFRLQPGEQSGLLEQLGLKAGDIVTSVNGTELTDPLKGMEVLKSLANEDRIDLQVKRDNKLQFVHITLPH